MPTSSSSTPVPSSGHSTTTTTRNSPPSANPNLARIRDNQRRSRARRKEYLNDLEDKFRKCEQLGVEATSEMQVAARKVLEENNKLRAFLREKGFGDDELDAWMDNIAETGSREGSRGVDSPVLELTNMIGSRRRCCPGLGGAEEEEEVKPAVAALAPNLGSASHMGSASGTTRNTPVPPTLPVFSAPSARNQTPLRAPTTTQIQPDSASASTQFGSTSTSQEWYQPNFEAYPAQLLQFQQYIREKQQEQVQPSALTSAPFPQHHQQPGRPQPQPQPQLASSHPQNITYNQTHNQASSHMRSHSGTVPNTEYYNSNNNATISDDLLPPLDYYNTIPMMDTNFNFDSTTFDNMDNPSSYLISQDMQAQFLRGSAGGSGANGQITDGSHLSYQ